MQSLTEAPRQYLSNPQVLDVLQTSPRVNLDYGYDLLDSNDNFVEALAVQSDGVITRDNYATVHASITFTIDRLLPWGASRVRPYILLSSDTNVNVRFDLGVYILTSPQQNLSSDTLDETSYSVTGYDKLYLLNQPIGDTLSAPAGDNVLQTIAVLIQLAGGGTRQLIDATATGATLASTLVWPLSEQSSVTTWLDAINDLLGTINYRGLWVDQLGRYRSEPYIDPSVRTIEYTFDSTDPLYSIVDPNARSVSNDQWSVPNHWVFVMNGLTVAPANGSGMYIVDNVTQGLSSQNSLGRIVPAVYFLDAVDQPTLQALGDNQVNNDLTQVETWSLTTGPLFIAGHFDVFQYIDPKIEGGIRKMQAQSWSLPLNGDNMTWVTETVATN